MKNTPENDEASSDHESGIASSTVPPSPIHYFPPAVRQAAFNSRSSSHSSMGSFNRGHLSEADHQPSRPSTPMSFAPPESIANTLLNSYEVAIKMAENYHSVVRRKSVNTKSRSLCSISEDEQQQSSDQAEHIPLKIFAPNNSLGDSGISKSWAPKPQGNSTVLQHLHKHASTFGLDVSSFQSRADSYSCAEKIDEKKMSNQGDNIHHQGPAFLSWRKLHLSKAKLKAASNTSALLAGFAMVAVVEIQLNNNNPGGEQLPKPLLFLFAICTTMLVAVHMLALLISTCILPNMEAISNLHILSLVNESPHEKMHMYIELAWGCSTVLGILLFMVEVAILCWIQFYSVLKEAAYVATAILVPFVILFIWFAIIFYRNLVAHTYETRKCGIQELEELKHVLEMGDELTTREIRSSPLVNI